MTRNILYYHDAFTFSTCILDPLFWFFPSCFSHGLAETGIVILLFIISLFATFMECSEMPEEGIGCSGDGIGLLLATIWVLGTEFCPLQEQPLLSLFLFDRKVEPRNLQRFVHFPSNKVKSHPLSHACLPVFPFLLLASYQHLPWWRSFPIPSSGASSKGSCHNGTACGKTTRSWWPYL